MTTQQFTVTYSIGYTSTPADWRRVTVQAASAGDALKLAYRQVFAAHGWQIVLVSAKAVEEARA